MVHIVQDMFFPVAMYGCECWTIKKAEHQRTDAFELWCWRRLLRVLRIVRRSHQSILKEISPGCSLEGLMLKLNLEYLGHWCKEPTHWKRPWCWERLRAGEGDEIVGWHHRLNAQEFEWTLGVGQGGLVCCSPCGHKELDMTELLNWIQYHSYHYGTHQTCLYSDKNIKYKIRNIQK